MYDVCVFIEIFLCVKGLKGNERRMLWVFGGLVMEGMFYFYNI